LRSAREQLFQSQKMESDRAGDQCARRDEQWGKLTIESGNAQLDEHYCRKYPEVVPGPYVRISVTDNGTGMKADVLRRAFEPFFTTTVRPDPNDSVARSPAGSTRLDPWVHLLSGKDGSPCQARR
jgi:hypothetical protein